MKNIVFIFVTFIFIVDTSKTFLKHSTQHNKLVFTPWDIIYLRHQLGCINQNASGCLAYESFEIFFLPIQNFLWDEKVLVVVETLSTTKYFAFFFWQVVKSFVFRRLKDDEGKNFHYKMFSMVWCWRIAKREKAIKTYRESIYQFIRQHMLRPISPINNIWTARKRRRGKWNVFPTNWLNHFVAFRRLTRKNK